MFTRSHCTITPLETSDNDLGSVSGDRGSTHDSTWPTPLTALTGSRLELPTTVPSETLNPQRIHQLSVKSQGRSEDVPQHSHYRETPRAGGGVRGCGDNGLCRPRAIEYGISHSCTQVQL